MTLEERAACIADISIGAARGMERRRRVYERALQMLREATDLDWNGMARRMQRHGADGPEEELEVALREGFRK